MFGTIIMDVYKKNECSQLADAIEEICSPLDSYGWASAGIYSFWDYNTEEILYIGLAADLSERFKQHNGINLVGVESCKYEQIQKYFSENERLGFSILTQSPLSQPITHRNEKLYRKFLNVPQGIPIENYAGEEGKENIRRAEGQLIEAYRLAKGDIPKWNKMGGDLRGKSSATKNNYIQIVRAFSRKESSSLLVAKSTIRELSQNATYAWYENYLHGIRMMMLTMGMSFDESVKFQKRFNPYFEENMKRIESDKYMEKSLEL